MQTSIKTTDSRGYYRRHRPFGEVPESDAAVLRIADDELLSRVEHGTRHVVIVTSAGIHLPCLGIWCRDIGHERQQNNDRVNTVTVTFMYMYVYKIIKIHSPS
jgi:hypothetical protein